MSTLQSFRLFVNERLTAAAVEIFEAVEKTVEGYQEENVRLRRMLRITPEIKLSRIDSLQFSVSEEEVPPEQQHCEQEWSPSLVQEDPEPTQIKEEQEELRTSQEEEQLQGLLDTKDSILTPPCVESECDQENPLWSLTPPRSQTEKNRESDSKQVDLTQFSMMTPLRGVYLPPVLSDNQNNASSPISTGQQLPTKSNTGRKSLSCGDCGKTFKYKKSFITHRLTHTRENSFKCGDCGKNFSRKSNLLTHRRIHTGEKPFSCEDCGKRFFQKGNLITHKQSHTGTPPTTKTPGTTRTPRRNGKPNVPTASKVHPDIYISPLTPENEKYIARNYEGRPDRYAALLFKISITEDLYQKWVRNTNWSGSRKKFALPQNLRMYILATVSQKIPFITMDATTLNEIKNRINEYLRRPRQSGCGLRSLI